MTLGASITLLEGLDDACVIRDCEVVGIAYDSRKVEVVIFSSP